MTAIEYFEKQLGKHKANYERESRRGVPEKMLSDIQAKISYYEQAVVVLKAVEKN